MQTKEQRKYWAERRKYEIRQGKQLPKTQPKPVLLATTLQEYKQLKRDYPDMEVKLDTSGQTQQQLFSTREFYDA